MLIQCLAYAGTLELKTEKANAHNTMISSVAYSPDGLQMVSSDYDGTLKVWDAINTRPYDESEWQQADYGCWENKITGAEQRDKPSGVGEWPIKKIGSYLCRCSVQYSPPSMPGSGIQVGIQSQITRSS